MFLSLAQGSRNAPLCLGRLAALLIRPTQSLFASDEVRLACVVDDPIVALLGTEAEQMTFVTIIVMVWSALGFLLRSQTVSSVRKPSGLDFG